MKTQRNDANNCLVVFGKDRDGQARAASFGAEQTRLALKAAQALKFKSLSADSDALRALAEKLPTGRIHASGLGVVPRVRPKLWLQLCALAGVDSDTQPLPGADESASSSEEHANGKQTHRLPADWQSIEVGDLVIAQEDDKADGWWPAIVVEKSGDRFTLRWHDYPRQRKVIRQRINLGLFNPGVDADNERAKPAEGGSRYPSSWNDISVGHLVLAQDDGPLGAWWPAIVAESSGDQITLRWHDHERLPAVIRERTTLALLHPQPD